MQALIFGWSGLEEAPRIIQRSAPTRESRGHAPQEKSEIVFGTIWPLLHTMFVLIRVPLRMYSAGVHLF